MFVSVCPFSQSNIFRNILHSACMYLVLSYFMTQSSRGSKLYVHSKSCIQLLNLFSRRSVVYCMMVPGSSMTSIKCPGCIKEISG